MLESGLAYPEWFNSRDDVKFGYGLPIGHEGLTPQLLQQQNTSQSPAKHSVIGRDYHEISGPIQLSQTAHSIQLGHYFGPISHCSYF